ncbi:MAG: hypothetical protein AAGL96_05770 [Pseudomonadota bacterium]
MSQTSFEERLARIQKTRGDTATPAPATPAPQIDARAQHMLPKAPLADHWIKDMLKGLFSAFGALGSVIKIGLACFAALAYFMMSSEAGFVNTSLQAADDEANGRMSLERMMVGGDMGSDIAFKMAVRQAEKRLASGELTPDKERKTRAFIKQHKGKSTADIMRGSMSGMLSYEARELGQPFLAAEIERKMKACQTSNCLAAHEARYRAQLAQLRARTPDN